VWRTLRRSDGLPADAVTAVAADLAGGIWFATDAGVAYRTAEGGWASLDFQRPLGLEDGVVTRIGIDTQGRPWFVAPAGVSALLAGGPATGRPKIAVARQPAAPTPANVMTPAPRKSATSAALLIEPLTGVVVDAPFIMLGSIPISRSTFSIIFFTVFTLAVIGAFLLLLRILLQLRKRGANAAKPADRATSLASAPANREEEILLPARLNDDESLAPEIAAALAELDRYADGTAHRISLRSDEMSPVPTQEQEMQDSLQGPGEEMPVGAPAVAPPIALDAYTQEATVEDIPALMEQGRDFAHAGRKPAAYDYFSTVTRLAPDHLEAWMWKGATAAHPQEAVRCLQKAVELAPDNERARAGLNWALSRLAASEAPAAEES
jgi:hypothetical protein